MLRITAASGQTDYRVVKASMRPQRDAADNVRGFRLHALDDGASMRPQRDAADNESSQVTA